MMVEFIEVRQIKALDPMRAFLEAEPHPKKLSELYAKLLSQYTSHDLENESLQPLPWTSSPSLEDLSAYLSLRGPWH